MDRRAFLQAMGAAGTVLTAAHSSASSDAAQPSTAREPQPQNKTWLFWDLWHLERQQNLELCQGKPFRLEVRLRDAEIYAMHGNFHFLDAQDWWMLLDGQPINPHAGL